MAWQAILNAVASSAAIVLLGLAASYLFAVSGFISFSIALAYVIGGYAMWLVGGPPVMAFLLALAGAVSIGALCELAVFRPLRLREAPALVIMLASLGLYAFGQNAISASAGDDIKSVAVLSLSHGVSIGPGRLSLVQVLILVSAVLITSLVWFFERHSKYGIELRALTCDRELAAIVGVSTHGVIFGVVVVTSAVAGLAGALAGLDTGLTPTMGMPAFMTSAAAVLIGGVGNVKGVILGAILVGSSQQIAVWVLGSEWQQAVVFLVLFVALLIKPGGLIKNTRI